MTVSVLIDTQNMKFLKMVSHKQSIAMCDAWADLLIPHHDFLVVCDMKRSLSVFSEEELIALVENSGGFLPSNSGYASALSTASKLLNQVEEDETPLSLISDMIKKQQKDNPALIPEKFVPSPIMTRAGQSATKKISKENSSASNPWAMTKDKKGRVGITIPDSGNRPKPGSTTGKVWEVADNLYTKGDSITKELRTFIINACVDQGINAATASTQYAKWKKYTLAS